MVANPITQSDIAAFAAGTGVEISPWEWGLIGRLDQAVLAIIRTTKPGDIRNETDASDGAGIKSLMKGLGAASGR